MEINCKDLKTCEKKLKMKCIYIDWRYDTYYFSNNEDTELKDCLVLDSIDIMEVIAWLKKRRVYS